MPHIALPAPSPARRWKLGAGAHGTREARRRARNGGSAALLLVAAAISALGMAAVFVLPRPMSTAPAPGGTAASLANSHPHVHALSRDVASRAAAGTSETAEARENFLALLEAKGGDWRDEAVLSEIERLEAMNPTSAAALAGTYLDANWIQVSRPDFNFASTENGSTVYTLGQLSFNMYEPADLKFRIDSITQLVKPLHVENNTRAWDISLQLTAVDDRYPQFSAEMTTFGQITPKDDKEGKDRRLEVWFTKGEFRPAGSSASDNEALGQWREIFGTAQKEKKRTFGTMLKNGFLWLLMGLQPPNGVGDDGTVTFEMRRPPHGYTDILYIDDKMRITRGNRGSIVVATREV